MSNEEHTHRNEWQGKPGIIEKHYGFTHHYFDCQKPGVCESPNCYCKPKLKGLTAEEAGEAIKKAGEAALESMPRLCDVLKDRKEILIHRGNVKMDLDDHTTDSAGYLAQGSPHIPFDKPAVKRAEDVHKKVMAMDFKIRTKGLFFIPPFISYCKE